jgi:Holliday junction resolvasome RuvABC endonuclease subunit
MFEMNLDNEESATPLEVQKLKVEDLLGRFQSAIGLDISKRSTGVCIWYNGKIETYAIHLSKDVDLSEPFAEETMRREFRNKLSEIIQGRNFEYGVVENVFGGENFDTVRKLLALNTVFDGMIMDGVCNVEHYYKRGNQEWKKYFRKVYKVGKAPTDKYEIQEIMRYLEYGFFLEHENDKQSVKDKIGFQDILDATGILCALSIEKKCDLGNESQRTVSISKVKLHFYQSDEDFEKRKKRSKYLKDADITQVELGKERNVERRIVEVVTQDSGKVYMMHVPNERLGYFGLKHKLGVSESGYMCVVFNI